MTNEDLQTARILIGRMNLEDTKHMYDLLATRVAMLQQMAKFRYSVGDTVTFTGKYGALVKGTITKINQKTIKVKADQSAILWTVSPSLLSLAA